jgi:hypothetical protein
MQQMEINFRASALAFTNTLPHLNAGLNSTIELLIDVLERDIQPC